MNLTDDEISLLLKALNIYTFFFIILIAFCFFATIFVLIMLSRNIKARRQLQENTQFISEIVSVQEKERSRISQELHDTVSQNIKVLLMMEKKIFDEYEKSIQNEQTGQSVADKLTEQNKQIELIQKIIYFEKHNQKQLRSIIQNLAVPELAGVSFKMQIESICEEFQSQSGIKCTFFVAENIDLEKFSSDERHHILRIIQEALTNAKNHAKPTETSVIFQKRQNKIYIMIFDDGIGFDESKVAGEKHFGMSGMEMRAKLLGGKFSVKTSSETGTQIRIELEGK